MRNATLVIVTYVLVVILTAIWHRLPIGIVADSAPNIGALTAAYLGVTARRGLAPSMVAAVAAGYLVDVLSGFPPGYQALVLGLTCIVAYGTQRRILVRGTAMTLGFSGFVAVAAGLLGLGVRMAHGIVIGGLGQELTQIAVAALASMLIGAWLWRGFRRIDAAFARTSRERDAALEGLAP